MARTGLQLQQQQATDARVLAAVPATVPGMTCREVARAAGMTGERTGRSLHRLMTAGQVTRDRTYHKPAQFATGGSVWRVTYRRGV